MKKSKAKEALSDDRLDEFKAGLVEDLFSKVVKPSDIIGRVRALSALVASVYGEDAKKSAK